MASAVLMVILKVKLHPEQRKAMLIVLDLQRLRNARTRHVQTTYLERNGSVVAQRA